MVIWGDLMKILLVEDDLTLASGIEYTLNMEGYNVSVANNYEKAVILIDEKDFDLYVLDITLPDGNGFDLCKYIRTKNTLPIIFLTAEDDEVNIVRGLDLGGDDYIVKPFKVREFISRIKAVFRRTGKEINPTIRTGKLEIKPLENKVFKGKVQLNLTPSEYRLLILLIENKKQVLSRTTILEKLWDIEGDFIDDNTLSVYIKRLREKIEDDSKKPRYIKTVRGVGYIWNREVD